MMLGIAARSSIAVPNMPLRRLGASSTRNSATTRLIGAAISSAIAVDATVP